MPWGTFLRSSPVWAIIVAHFCFNWGYYTLLAWLPSYFDMALGEHEQAPAGSSRSPVQQPGRGLGLAACRLLRVARSVLIPSG